MALVWQYSNAEDELHHRLAQRREVVQEGKKAVKRGDRALSGSCKIQTRILDESIRVLRLNLKGAV